MMVNGWYMQRNPRIEPEALLRNHGVLQFIILDQPEIQRWVTSQLLGTTGELEGLLEESQNVNFKTPAGRGNVL